jgi:hypothetical protein
VECYIDTSFSAIKIMRGKIMKKKTSNTKDKDLKWMIPDLMDLAKMGQISSHGQATASSCRPGGTATACDTGIAPVACGGGSTDT